MYLFTYYVWLIIDLELLCLFLTSDWNQTHWLPLHSKGDTRPLLWPKENWPLSKLKKSKKQKDAAQHYAWININSALRDRKSACLCFLDFMVANMGGFSIFSGSWGTWLSAVWLSVCMCVFMKCILGATLALDLSVQTGCLLCLSLSGVCFLYTYCTCARTDMYASITHTCMHVYEHRHTQMHQRNRLSSIKWMWHLVSTEPAVSIFASRAFFACKFTKTSSRRRAQKVV